MFPQNLWVRSLRAPTRANLRSWSMESSQRRRTPLEATPFAPFRFSNSHLTWLEFGERKKLKFYWLLPTPKLSCVSSIITTNFVFIFITIIIILPASLHLHHHHHHQHTILLRWRTFWPHLMELSRSRRRQTLIGCQSGTWRYQPWWRWSTNQCLNWSCWW